MFIHKVTKSDSERVYIINAYYNQVLLGTLELKVLKDYKGYTPMTFTLDKRLARAKEGYFNAEGIYRYSRKEFASGTPVETYIDMMKVVHSNFTQTARATVEKVYNYENENQEENGYKFFYSMNTDAGGIGIKSGTNPDFLGKNLYVWKDVNKAWTEANVATKESAVIPVQVNDTGEEKVESTGTIVYSDSATVDEATWDPFSTGQSQTNGVSIRFTSGYKLFNTRSATNQTGNSIVTRLVVKTADETVELGNQDDGKVGTPKEVTLSSGNKIKINADGTVTIKGRQSAQDETVVVEIYYKDILLGKTKLTIPKYEIVEIGEATVNIDSRVKQIPQKWISGTGDISRRITGEELANYGELVTVTPSWNLLDSIQIVDVDGVEGRDTVLAQEESTPSGKKYRKYGITGQSWTDESAVPFDFDLQQINDYILVSGNNGTGLGLQNIFTLVGANRKRYKGNFIEKYQGEETQTAEAVLDTREITSISDSRGPYGVFNPGATGEVEATNNPKFKLKFTKGPMFDVIGKRNKKTIVTKIVLKENGQVIKEVTGGDVGYKLEAEAEYIIVGFETDGSMYIHKKKINKASDKVYDIEAWYNGVKLGTLKLKVLKDYTEYKPIRFQIDKRLVAKNGYVNAQGIYKSSIDEFNKRTRSTTDLTYQELVKVVESDYPNQQTTIEGVIGYSKVVEKSGYKFFNHIEGAKNTIAVKSETVNDLLSQYTYIHKESGENWIEGKLKTTNAELIPIEVEEIGDVAENAEGIVEFTNNKREITLEPSQGDTTIDKVKVTFTKGKVFNPKSAVNTKGSIVTRLVVTDETEIETVEANGTAGAAIEVNLSKGELFKINADGTITIKGREQEANNTYLIEIYHNNILLGKMKLTLKTKSSLIIEGGDRFDFGKMVKGREYTQEGVITIKNSAGITISKVEVPKTGSMIHKHSPSSEIPLSIASSVKENGVDREVYMNLKAKTSSTQEVGEYEGEISIIVTIK